MIPEDGAVFISEAPFFSCICYLILLKVENKRRGENYEFT